jgi:exopolysaccharide production protein ExoZ
LRSGRKYVVFIRMRKQAGTIDGIQVLRAIASLMVVVHHSRHSVPGSEVWPHWGAAGVDIFFVISGFVMAYTTQQADVANINERLSEAGLFLRKRIARIVPLYWLALLWTTRRTMPDLNLFKDFTFIPHWNAQYPTNLYPIVIQGWTLNYEMFFYVLFAVAMLFGSLRVLVLLGALMLVPLLTYPLIGGSLDVFGHFYCNDVILEFGFGVLLQRVIARSDFPDWSRFAYFALMLFGFIGLWLGYDFEPRSVFQGLPAFLVVWASFKACEGWLRWKMIALLGDASYAIYLFHWASFGAMKPVAAWIGTSYINSLMILHILTATIAGILIHLLIEQRLLWLAKRLLGLSQKVALVQA